MVKIKKVILIVLVFILTGLIYNSSYATEINTNTYSEGKFHYSEGFKVPETNINLKVENIINGCKVYLLIPENLLKYNMEKYIQNNTENPYQIEAQQAEKLKKFLDKGDYLGYIEYFKDVGFDIKENEIEIRHYCFCLGTSNVIGYYDYNNVKYVQIEINLNENNEFKLILKDYLTRYNSSDIKFMIDEYGTERYIDLEATPFTTNPEQSNITECNITYTLYNTDELKEIEKATQITYLIIYIILLIIVIIILIILIKRHLRKKQEIEDRKFWKKKLTKEEKKELKEQIKQLKKANRKNKKGKKK